MKCPSITDEPFNARPDNTPAGNRQAIIEAIAYLRSRYGGSMFIPDERFEIDQPIIVPPFVNYYSGVHLFGMSRRATITAALGFPQFDDGEREASLFRFEGSGCKVSGFTLDGQNQVVRGVTFSCENDGFHQNSVRDMKLVSLNASNIVNEGAWNLQILDNEFLIHLPVWAIECKYNGTNSILQGNDVNGGQGIFIGKPANRQQNEGTIINDNGILTPHGDGLVIEGGLEIYVTNNVIDQIGRRGLFVPSAGKGISGLKVTNNWIVGGTNQPAVEVEGDNEDMLFVGNTIENGCVTSFNGQVGGGIHRPVFRDNRFRGRVPHDWEQFLALAVYGAKSAFNFGTGRIYIGGNCPDWNSVGDRFHTASNWGSAHRLGG